MIPDNTIRRIQTPPPSGTEIVVGSTPVVSFGNPALASVATLSINPSFREFQDHLDRFLSEPERRLETLTSLGLDDYEGIGPKQALRIAESCYCYFHRNPYWEWFGKLETIMKDLGTSYANGTACHLDLVQWATKPIWSGLTCQSRERLLAADRQFIREQIEIKKWKVVLLNGASVIREFERVFGVQLRNYLTLRIGWQPTQVRQYILPNGSPVVGWSVNLQSSRGVRTELMDAIRTLLPEMIRTQ